MFHDLKWLFVVSNWITAGTFLSYAKNTIFESRWLLFDNESFQQKNNAVSIEETSKVKVAVAILLLWFWRHSLWNPIFEILYLNSLPPNYFGTKIVKAIVHYHKTYLYSILQTRLKIHLGSSCRCIVINATNFFKKSFSQINVYLTI